AYFDLGDVKNARKILTSLFEIGRPDWKEVLTFWDHQLNEAEKSYGTVKTDPASLEITTMTLNRPVWTVQLPEYQRLLPAKPENAPQFVFISSSCVMSEKNGGSTLQ